MVWLRWQKVVGLAVLLVLLAGVAPLFAQTGGVSGVAKGDNGELLVGCHVIIERQDVKATYKTKTNKKGEYIYIGLPPGPYKITLQDPSGKDLWYVTVRVSMLGESLAGGTVVDFDLAKEHAAARAEQERRIQANPELARQMAEAEKEQKQLTGLKELYEAGEALLGEKKYAEAAGVFERALPLAKGNNVPVVLGRLAESYQKARQFDKAVDYYRKAVEANPTDSDLRNNLGNALAEMGKSAEALQEFQKAAELNPAKAARYYFNLGAVTYNLGKMDEAASAFKKAIEIDAAYADAYFWLGQALMGKATMAPDGKVVAVPGTAEALETYLKLQPNGPSATTAQALLQTIQGQIQTQYKVEKKKKK
jgi:tetratricopeptide (TPR) repeat protein